MKLKKEELALLINNCYDKIHSMTSENQRYVSTNEKMVLFIKQEVERIVELYDKLGENE